MKRLGRFALYVAAVVWVWATYAHAKEFQYPIPSTMIGTWCHSPKEDRKGGIAYRHSACTLEKLKISKEGYEFYDHRCHFNTVTTTILKNRQVYIQAQSSCEGLTESHDPFNEQMSFTFLNGVLWIMHRENVDR